MLKHFKTSVAGPDHISCGRPCQDSNYFVLNDDGVGFGAVADGLGSEKYTDISSEIAARVSCEFCKEHYRSDMTIDQVKSLINNSFVHAVKQIIERSISDKKPFDQYDTTLCLAIFDKGHIYFGQAGDSGAVALMKDGRYIPITTQQRHENGGVYHLALGPKHWQFGEVEGEVSSLLLMTDGVWDVVCPVELQHEENPINVSFVMKFMDRQETDDEEVENLEQGVTAYLENIPRDMLNDDKTMLVFFDPENPAERLDEAYYAVPNWDELREKRKKLEAEENQRISEDLEKFLQTENDDEEAEQESSESFVESYENEAETQETADENTEGETAEASDEDAQDEKATAQVFILVDSEQAIPLCTSEDVKAAIEAFEKKKEKPKKTKKKASKRSKKDK